MQRRLRPSRGPPCSRWGDHHAFRRGARTKCRALALRARLRDPLRLGADGEGDDRSTRPSGRVSGTPCAPLGTGATPRAGSLGLAAAWWSSPRPPRCSQAPIRCQAPSSYGLPCRKWGDRNTYCTVGRPVRVKPLGAVRGRGRGCAALRVESTRLAVWTGRTRQVAYFRLAPRRPGGQFVARGEPRAPDEAPPPRPQRQMRRRPIAQVVSSWREESWSLRSTEETWVSTVLIEMNNSLATSLYW